MGKIITMLNILENSLLQSTDLDSTYENFVRDNIAKFRGNIDDLKLENLMNDLKIICRVFDDSKALFEQNREDSFNRKDYSIRKGRLLDKLEEIRRHALLSHLE